MKQKLGQHFLKNAETLSFIASHTGIGNNETLIEIGSGHGELTRFLIEKTKETHSKLLCIEKDKSFFDSIERIICVQQHNKLFRGDVREILPKLPTSEGLDRYVVVGNIPYYLTSFLFRIISELSIKPHTTTLLIQKEVAERAIQKPQKQNLLSAIVASFADAHIIKYVPRNQFVPPPRVDSAVLQLVSHNRYTKEEIKLYIHTAKILFSQPRKTLINNIRNNKEFEHIPERALQEIPSTLHIDNHVRAQSLTPEMILTITKILYNEG